MRANDVAGIIYQALGGGGGGDVPRPHRRRPRRRRLRRRRRRRRPLLQRRDRDAGVRLRGHAHVPVTRRYGLTDIARHVIERTLNRRAMSETRS